NARVDREILTNHVAVDNELKTGSVVEFAKVLDRFHKDFGDNRNQFLPLYDIARSTETKVDEFGAFAVLLANLQDPPEYEFLLLVSLTAASGFAWPKPPDHKKYEEPYQSEFLGDCNTPNRTSL
ncbi:unnamed protein product, partial [Amoebophrya sp. A120]